MTVAIDSKTRSEIISLLLPHITTEADRSEILQKIFYETFAQRAAEFDASSDDARSGLEKLVDYLAQAGELAPGLSALWALLEIFYEHLDGEDRPRVDQLRMILDPAPNLETSSRQKASIFISYSRKDAERVIQIANALKAEGFKVWLDVNEINFSPNYQADIEKAIVQASIFLLMASPASKDSEYVYGEFVTAKEADRRIIPIWLYGDTLSSSFALEQKRLDHMDARHMEPQDIVNELKRRLYPSTVIDNRNLSISFAPKYDGGYHWELESAVALVEHPELLTNRKSWRLSEVVVDYQNTAFKVPASRKAQYDYFYTINYNRLRFMDNGHKLFLAELPDGVLIDSPTLRLTLEYNLFSQAQFYSRRVAKLDREREEFIRHTFETRQITFAHAFCMHAIVVTSDDQVMLVQRSKRMAYHAGKWQCSISEQGDPQKDISDSPNGVLLRWAKRMLFEELSLKDQHGYHEEDLHLLSVFLESDILNVSLCAYIQLQMTAEELRKHTASRPPNGEIDIKDGRLTIDFIPFESLYEELFSGREYTPTARYVMTMALLFRHGEDARDKIEALGAKQKH